MYKRCSDLNTEKNATTGEFFFNTWKKFVVKNILGNYFHTVKVLKHICMEYFHFQYFIK